MLVTRGLGDSFGTLATGGLGALGGLPVEEILRATFTIRTIGRGTVSIVALGRGSVTLEAAPRTSVTIKTEL